jgi:hypothetical protein
LASARPRDTKKSSRDVASPPDSSSLPAESTSPAKSARRPQSNQPPTPEGVLAGFLAAKNLAERQAFMTLSKRSPGDLAQSSLAGPLPPVLTKRVLPYLEDRTLQHGGRFFEITFESSSEKTSAPILIQLIASAHGETRVHADAFIDLFEDSLAEFGKAPVEGTRTFHVVADAYKHCFDDSIPDFSRKAFIKLRTHPRISPRLKAYFDKESPLVEIVSRPDGLPWGASGICTLTLKWNTDSPDRPFVELTKVEGFTWNP